MGMILLFIVGSGSRAGGSSMGGGGRQCREVAGQVSMVVVSSWVGHGKARSRCEGGGHIKGGMGSWRG